MIVDATALPEQVADDVVTSAFRSAGQRCSALRLLFVQEDVADRMIEMIRAPQRTSDRRPLRSRHPCRAGDRPRGEAALDAHIAA
jgi:RHH-type proline utilization regulon transcriptional repressor/proline dehydrogenase/delta 1-pyrroline-5-carboxylate dehydrogenase